MQRQQKREIDLYGSEIENPSDPRYKKHKDFLEYAAAYDAGGLDMCSKASHERWLSKLKSPFLQIEGTQSVEENTRTIMQKIELNLSEASDCDSLSDP